MAGATAVRWRLPSRLVSWRARVVRARAVVVATWPGAGGTGGAAVPSLAHDRWLPGQISAPTRVSRESSSAISSDANSWPSISPPRNGTV
jgi:hypothetical protein